MIEASPAPLNGADLVSQPASRILPGLLARQPIPYRIRIRSKTELQARSVLMSILEELLPVDFFLSDQGQFPPAGEILFEGQPDQVQCKGIPSLKVSQDVRSTKGGGLVEIKVRFEDVPDVPFPFRGRSVRTRIASEAKILNLSNGEKALASNEDGPVWSVTEDGSAKHFRSGFPMPNDPVDGGLISVFNGEQFLEMLPVIHFVQTICRPSLYEAPPLRACFIFDDPNLHWYKYGFVDFEAIANHAAKFRYHVTFATIPLDSWFIHPGTVALFKRNLDRLSLMIHGNNHTYKELAQHLSQSKRASLLRQAIRRIERFEQKSDLRVARAMVPPHGACSEVMLADLPRCGFEAAIISHGSLHVHNKGRLWTRNLGYNPSELIHGCPVLPRWGLAGNTKNTILLAAFLGQPIILRGHHTDLKNGIEILDQLAQFINNLGSVIWADATTLNRINYVWLLKGNLLRLNPLGLKLKIKLPNQATHVTIENPHQKGWENWQISDANGTISKACARESILLPVGVDRELFMEAVSESSVSTEEGSTRPAVWALIRRLITECRDRIHALS